MSEAGLGPATELEVEHSPRAEFLAQPTHTSQGRRERRNRSCMAAVSGIYRYQGSLVFYTVEWRWR